MPTELETRGVPPVPSVWRLAWLLFTQPIALHQMYRAWALEGNPSLITLWYEEQGNKRDLIARHGLLLLVIMPLIATLISGTLALSGVPVQLYGVTVGVAVGIFGGVAASVAGGVAFGLVFGVAFGVAFGMAGGSAFGLAFGAVFGGIFGVEVGVTMGVMAGVVISLMLGAEYPPLGAEDVVFGVALGATSATVFRAFGVGRGMIIGALAVILGGSYFFGLVVNVKFGVIFGITFGVTFGRLPLWLTDAFLTQMLAWRMRRSPDTVRHLTTWIPFRNEDLIDFPLPGLRACLIQVAEAEIDPLLAAELVALAAASTSQHRIARGTLIELQARALERVARGRLFARAAGLDLPFLPTEADLASEPANAPFLTFQTAARDLIAGSTNQRRRRLALDRARSTLESFRITTTGASRPTPLARRLLPIAALWLDVIRDEDAELTREVAAHPQVPSAFIAGLPLTPERAEDRTLFKGRSDIIKLIEHDLAPDRRSVLFVVGQRRMGKTSLCNYLPSYLGTGTTVVVSNFQPLSGDAHRETPHRRVLGDVAARSIGTPSPPDVARWGDGLRWLEDLDRTCADRKILVVIDEVERVEDGIRDRWCSTDFLDFLRAAGDALRHIRFLLLTAYPLHRLGPHWTDRLVSVTSRTISYLGEEDARELLTRPIPEFPDIYPEGGVDRILDETGRHPYLLQKAGDDLCRLLNSRGGLRKATAEELTEVFDGMVRDAQVFDVIWRSRTQDEQATLHRLAKSDEPGHLDPSAIVLAREDYLVRRGDQVTIAVPLFREWIRMNVM